MGMDQELAAMYGTPGGATQEDVEKQAEAELFAKLASQNGINLNDLEDSQIAELWEATFGEKVAGGVCPECKKENCTCPAADKEAQAKLAEAQIEFQKKQEWQEKVAECDKLGRVMAHAYVQELDLIKQAHEKSAGEMPPQFAKKNGDEEKKDEKKEESKDEGNGEKEASAIDHLAAKHAIKLASDAGLDTNVAAKRVEAVLTLGGPASSEKTASAGTLDETIHIRALEFLESAGYPVNWEGGQK